MAFLSIKSVREDTLEIEREDYFVTETRQKRTKMTDVRVSQVTTISTVYKVRWRNVAIATVWLLFVTWMITFPFYVKHLGDQFSGRCMSDDGFDQGERTTHMLGSLIWIHGTWIFLILLAAIYGENSADDFLAFGLVYIIASFVFATVIGYIIAAPNACFTSYRDMYILLIFANLIYMIIAGAISVFFVVASCIGTINLCSKIPAFFFEKETVEIPA